MSATKRKTGRRAIKRTLKAVARTRTHRSKTWDPKNLPRPSALKAVAVEGGSNQYVNVSFDDGSVVRLYPIGIGRTKKVVAPARDVLVSWLQRELGVKSAKDVAA